VRALYLLILFSVPIGSSAANNLNFASPSCRFALDASGVWQGEPADEFSDENWNVFLLGGGIGGALVYRYVAKDGSSSHVKKVYKSLAEANRDYANFHLLEQAINEGLHRGRHIRVAKVLARDGRVIWLEDIRGTDVGRLYRMNADSRKLLKDKLFVGLNIVSASLVDYSRKPEQFNKFQFNAFPRPDDPTDVEDKVPRLHELSVLFEARHPKDSSRWIRRNILIHSENIILEPNGMMVIIDPG
jgi:hypothetical protein